MIYLDPREWEGFDVTDDKPDVQKPQEQSINGLCWYYDRFTRVEKGQIFVEGRSYEAASAAERPQLRAKLLDYFDRWARRQSPEKEADLRWLRLRLQILLARSGR